GWHMEMARELAAWVDAEPDAERLAPVPFSTVCLRWRPAAWIGREADPAVSSALDSLNAQLMDAVNATGEVFLSHTRLDGRFTIRVAINHIRTERRHIERAWELITEHGRRLAPTMPEALASSEVAADVQGPVDRLA
ncbi:MAG TPA: hypothetical protein VGP30_02970, partial [Candidatus Limnocylindrales bacterium]|nr:hypothetical protein [Candidatus Limnocylindrales bacterium]